MLDLAFVTLDVFTSTRFQGNPLAIVRIPPGVRLSLETKQAVAREFNFSETVFLHGNEHGAEEPAGEAIHAMDIFTPVVELPFAGHPTIGTAYLVLKSAEGEARAVTPQKALLKVKAGPIPVEAVPGSVGTAVRASVPHDFHVHGSSLRSVLGTGPSGTLGFGNADIATATLDAPVVSIVKGMTFLLVRLQSLAHLAMVNSTALALERSQIDELLDQGPWHSGSVGLYYYVPTGDKAGNGATLMQTRMISHGVEDPATGSAACALASYRALQDQGLPATGAAANLLRYDIVQGVEMGRRSEITVEVRPKTDGSGIETLLLGGTAVEVTRGTIRI